MSFKLRKTRILCIDYYLLFYNYEIIMKNIHFDRLFKIII